MKTTWHRFLAPLTPGVRVLLLLLSLSYLGALAGSFSRAYNLYPWLGLSGPGFWSGKVWPVVTYAFLPASPFDFLFNWLVILFLGIWIERYWSRRQFLIYCLVCAVGAGIAKVVFQPSNHRLMVGTAPILFGLLAAWGWLFANEKALLWFVWETTVPQAACLLAVISFVVMVPCAGIITSIIMLCGGLAGLVFLWLEARILRSHASQSVVSQRMGRLEL